MDACHRNFKERVLFKTILTPTDGSAHAALAVTLAGDLAVRYGARLILLHVLTNDSTKEGLARLGELESITVPSAGRRVAHLEATPQGPVAIPGGAADESERRAALAQAAHDMLDRTKETLRQRGIEEIIPLVQHGDPADRILETARREQADAIVMGSRGLGEIKGMLVGSVSRKVAHDADCACITATAKRRG